MENFSESTATALQNAFQMAQQRHNPEVTENHLLLAFLEDPEGYFTSLLEETKLDVTALSEKVSEAVDHLPTYTDSVQPPKPAQNFQNRVIDAQNFAKEFEDSYVSGDHFLLSYWKGEANPFKVGKAVLNFQSMI